MLKALIVDDEPLARSELRYLLEKTASVRVVGEAGNADEAYELIKNIDYDVVFLDVRMPGLSGTELARRIGELPKRPVIVFVSAYSEHALEAFEVEADDYLVKPVSEERLQKTIQKLEKRILKENAQSSLPAIISDMIFVDLQEKKIPVRIDSILYFEAVDDYSRLHLEEKSYLLRFTLKNLEEKLLSKGFLRVHRKYLVNTSKIKEIVQLSRNTFVIRLNNNKQTEIPISRRKIPVIKKLFEL